MKHQFTAKFIRSYHTFPKLIQLKFDKQLHYLLQNIRYPSLHAKKYDEARGIWQARADKGVRFYFLINNDTYILLDIEKHSN
ncbi:MAG: hypothetical protein Q7K44_02620 [Candidatus Liptonbacteria bacterium]|nr:hypothetical protein [Candidatus Liptonbacteria bacterium]